MIGTLIKSISDTHCKRSLKFDESDINYYACVLINIIILFYKARVQIWPSDLIRKIKLFRKNIK